MLQPPGTTELQAVTLLQCRKKNVSRTSLTLTPSTPAVGLLDHIGGWRRAYADGNAVLHVRTGRTP